MQEKVSARQYTLLVAATAFCCLMFELIVSRVAEFYLGSPNDFLALPITFLGLALGSLHVHFSTRLVGRFSIGRSLLSLGAASFVTIFVILVVFTRFMPVVGAFSARDHLPFLFVRTVIFIGIFVIPFYVFGRILTVCYYLNRERIGRIYGADLVGAAAACFATPWLFHFVSLPAVVTILLGAVSLLIVIFQPGKAGARVALMLVLALVNVMTFFASAKLERSVRFLYRARSDNPPEVTELASRWNEFSRTQLIRLDPPSGSSYYSIIHDNARSNVHVRPFVPGRSTKPDKMRAIEVPFIMGSRPKDIMVMFAGCGAEMIEFYELAGVNANITGVEINGLCRELPTEHPDLAGYRLQEFYDLPNIDLRIQEGRSFLIQNEKKFDVIFIGSSAALSLAFTGHSRKYLYTEEALRLYLGTLNKGGMILFEHQPVDTTIESLKRIFEADGRRDFAKCVVAIESSAGGTDLLFKPDGYTRKEVKALSSFDSAARKRLRYAPFGKPRRRPAKVEMPPSDDLKRIIDDRPYVRPLDFGEYALFAKHDQLKVPKYYKSWMKITTMLLMTGISLVLIAIAAIPKTRRLPAPILGFLLITGFCYLLIEVAFIARLELFLQDPLISMSCVVSAFLLTSALGSATYKQVAGRLGMRIFPFLVALVVFPSIWGLHFMVTELMALPLWLRICMTIIAVFPVGWLLGMFYPFAVSRLVKHKCEQAVPITYAVSTLSSVVGATFSMTMMINWGFSRLIFAGGLAYVMLGLLVTLYSMMSRRNLLA